MKGSVPARTDVDGKDLDACGQQGMKDLAEASKNGTLFGSMAHGHAAPAAVKNATYDVITAALQRRDGFQDRRGGTGEGRRRPRSNRTG